MSVFLLSLYRCRGCRRRFYRFSVGAWKDPAVSAQRDEDDEADPIRGSNREQFWGY